jgi:hypothetical protein
MKIKDALNLKLLLSVFFVFVIAGCDNSNDSDNTKEMVTPEPHDVHCPP